MNVPTRKSRIAVTIFVLLILGVASAAAWQAMRSRTAAATKGLETRLYFSHAFEEPLVPMGPTSAAEDKALLHAIGAYEASRQPADFDAIQIFLKRYPHSAWRVALLTDEGLADYRAGYFDRAIAAYGEAWKLGKSATGVKQKALADRAFGELVQMHARLGHADTLAALLGEIKNRPITGRAAGMVEGAQEGLYEMRNDPGVSYLCGPMAVKDVLLALHPRSPKVSVLDDFRSGPHGVNLATVAKLATKVGLRYRMVYRKDPGASLPLPTIVHWRVNHYAAVIGFSHGRYHVEDPTFGEADQLWITPQALAAESDGYYLIPDTATNKQWASVSETRAKLVYGMGTTGFSNPYATSYEDVEACKCNGGNGMPVANAAALLASLKLTDTPLRYTPPKGPAMSLTLMYNHLDITQPANFTYGNVGPQWNMNWTAFIQDDPDNSTATVERVFGGGGAELDSGCSSWNCQFTREGLTGAILSRVKNPDGSVVYTLTHRDGSTDIYSQSDGATSAPRNIFLTQRTDPQGNVVTLHYDEQLRLTSVSDALGQNMTFHYDDAQHPLRMSSVTDPFGRSALLGYDADGRLASLTDEIGLTSSFAYDDQTYGDLVTTMTTPYGASEYAYLSGSYTGGDGKQHYYRQLTLTDPKGNTQKVE